MTKTNEIAYLGNLLATRRVRQGRTRRGDLACWLEKQTSHSTRGGTALILRTLFGFLYPVAVVLMLNTTSALGADEPELTRELGRDPLATYPVLIEIGESGYVIPRNYIESTWRLAADRPLQRVVLRVLWPGLEPLTLQNRHHWARREPDKQIKISIVRRSKDGYRGLQSGIDRGAFDEPPASFAYDLVKYQRKYYRRFLSTDETYRTPDNTPLVFACNDTDEETKAHFDFEPICETDYRLSDGTGLHYSFFMVNLAQWREIDVAVRALINSFRR